MQPSEEAQLLINQGALLRRLGDPIKAMQTYRQAQALFARGQHRDGEIGAWRNIGIAYALDLNDNQRALDAFGAALKLARESSNQRGEVQALLYRGETLRRLGSARRSGRASFDAALGGATRAGLVEEQWKALYSLGRVVEAERPRATRPGGRTSRQSPRSNRFAPIFEPLPSGRSSWPTSATSTTR